MSGGVRSVIRHSGLFGFLVSGFVIPPRLLLLLLRRAPQSDQLDFERQRRGWRDHRAWAVFAGADARRDHQRAPLAHLHALQAFVPTLDDHPLAEDEFDRLVAVLGGGVHLRAALELPGVEDRIVVARAAAF